MKVWQMLALIGTVIFLFSAAFPMVSIQFIAAFSIRLFDMYGWFSGFSLPENNLEWAQAFSTVGVGLFLAAILYPITVVFGFVSVAVSPKVCLIAGVLGMACWLSSLFAILQLRFVISQSVGPFANLIQIGYGVYLGIFASAVLLISYFAAIRESKMAVGSPNLSS